MNANLAEMLVAGAAAHPQRPAVYLGDRLVATYEQLADRVAAAAGGLREQLGLEPGDRVALAMRNCPEYVELLYAIWHAGLCAVPINAKLHPRETAYMVANSGARVCFTTDADLTIPDARMIAVPSAAYAALFDGAVQAEPAIARADDLAWLFYTSGTTGTPKGAMLSHGNLAAMALAYWGGLTSVHPDDRLIHVAPMSHGSGLYIVPYLGAGAAQVVPSSGGFDAAELVELIEHHGQACLFAAPTILQRLVTHLRGTRRELDGLKIVVCGGAPLYAEDARAALACLGPRVAQMYGQGESPMTIAAQSPLELAVAYAKPDDATAVPVGRAMPGVQLRIVDASCKDLPAGESGEILVHSPTVMRGYWRNPAATTVTLRDGWLRTGDIGSLGADGQLTLKDRSKDVIISGGSNIYPREIEDMLLMHPGIAEVSVVGRRHDEWGEEVVAFVVLHPTARTTAQELDAWCLEHVARFKRPKHYRFIDALPKNNYGKVLKRELRESLESSHGAGVFAAAVDA